MSYSRWLESYWYTYWCVKMKDEIETRDNAMFEVCAIACFTAHELRTDMESCIKRALLACENNTFQPIESEIDDLREFMKEFLADVDEKYPAVTSAT